MWLNWRKGAEAAWKDIQHQREEREGSKRSPDSLRCGALVSPTVKDRKRRDCAAVQHRNNYLNWNGTNAGETHHLFICLISSCWIKLTRRYNRNKRRRGRRCQRSVHAYFSSRTVRLRSLAADGVTATALSEGAVWARWCVWLKYQQLRVHLSGGCGVNLGFLIWKSSFQVSVAHSLFSLFPFSLWGICLCEKACLFDQELLLSSAFSFPTSLFFSLLPAF